MATVDVLDEEIEEVDHPNVVDDDFIDDVDNYIKEDSIDDDIDVNKPFINMYSEPNPNKNVELDEEEAE